MNFSARQPGLNKISVVKIFISLVLCAGCQNLLAQTNLVFQDCQPGDLVKVKCERPLLVLGKAKLLEIGSNTVTVATANDQFTLDQTNVILTRLENPAPAPAEISAPSAAMPAPTAPAASAPSMTDLAQTMEAIRASVIDPHKMEAYKEPKLVNGKWELVVDPNSPSGKAKNDQANAYYNTTMKGVLDGSVTQADLMQQAKKVLADCDKYAAERKDDPQYEKQIEMLRDFVRRSEAGEKIDFGQPVQ
jgi:hypothetical protein